MLEGQGPQKPQEGDQIPAGPFYEHLEKQRLWRNELKKNKGES